MKKFNYYNLVIALLIGACLFSCKNPVGLEAYPALEPAEQSVELAADVTHYQHPTVRDGWGLYDIALKDSTFYTKRTEIYKNGVLVGLGWEDVLTAEWIAAEWVKGAIDLKLEKNTTGESRTATISLNTAHVHCFLTITQKAAQ